MLLDLQARLDILRFLLLFALVLFSVLERRLQTCELSSASFYGRRPSFNGKRGPIAFFVAAIMLVYFMEGYGREKLYRVFKIAGLLVAMFMALAFLAKFTGSDGIKKIYETFQELITSGSVDDAGRTQLHEQAD